MFLYGFQNIHTKQIRIWVVTNIIDDTAQSSGKSNITARTDTRQIRLNNYLPLLLSKDIYTIHDNYKAAAANSGSSRMWAHLISMALAW